MKKTLSRIILLIALIVVVYLTLSKDTPTGQIGSKEVEPQAAPTQTVELVSEEESQIDTNIQTANENLNISEEKIIPASKAYKDAFEAFEAVLKGATNYDDNIIEQVAAVTDGCSWCEELYEKIRVAMLDPNTNENQRSYFAEILASTGLPDNISALINAYKDTKDKDDAGVFTEALELTTGDDETVEYLGTQLNTDDKDLKEALIAAVTNHGSPLAVELLYKETIENGDPDGYYSDAIGLGEVIPDEESLPYLTELAAKKDEYSHLAVKALLNYGIEGLHAVVDIIGNSDDLELNRSILKDAVDHVSYEDASKEFAEELLKTSQNKAVLEFAEKIVKEFADDDEAEEGEE